jgi:hypothetical protein
MAGTITLNLTGGAVRPLRMIGNYDLKVVTGQFTFDSAYLTGGESMAPSDIGLQEINLCIFEPLSYRGGEASGSNFLGAPKYDYTYNKVIAFCPSSNTEAATGKDLSSYTARFIAIGY